MIFKALEIKMVNHHHRLKKTQRKTRHLVQWYLFPVSSLTASLLVAAVNPFTVNDISSHTTLMDIYTNGCFCLP